MRRRLLILFGLFLGAQMDAVSAYANCALIDRLNDIFTIETRLASSPDIALFPTDIRQLRILVNGIEQDELLDAFGTTDSAEPGVTLLGFLDETRHLLLRADLGDPASVSSHFSANVRTTLTTTGRYLKLFRCTQRRIAVNVPIGENLRTGRDTDAEDVADAAETLKRIVDDVISLRTFFIAIGLGGVLSVAVPAFRRWQTLRRRRAKRHSTAYSTSYTWADHQGTGTLVDINCHGAKLQHASTEPPPNGAQLRLVIGDGTVKGTVVWSNLHYCGVQFRKSLSLSSVSVVCQQTQNGAPKGAA